MNKQFQRSVALLAIAVIIASLGLRLATAFARVDDDNRWWTDTTAPIADLPRDVWLDLREQVRDNIRGGIGGIQKATALTPATGLLVISRPGGVQTCSGVLIGERAFLTAAHCVCDDVSDFEPESSFATCAPTLPTVRTIVLMPAGGLFDTVGAPIVHPNYRAVDPAMDARARPVADLAIILLDRSPPVTPAVIGAPVQGERYLKSGFGHLVETPTRGDAAGISSLAPDTDYRPGTGQLSLLGPALLRANDCGEQPALDVFCTLHITVAERDPLRRTTSACGGDSGSALFAAKDGQIGAVVGLVSSLSDGDNCLGASSRFTNYIDVYRPEYRAWIARNAGPTVRPRAPWTCGDILVGDDVPSLRAAEGPGLITVMPVAPEGGRTPRIGIAGVDPGQCQFLPGLGAWTCQVRAGQRPIVRRDAGLAQITMCWNPSIPEKTP